MSGACRGRSALAFCVAILLSSAGVAAERPVAVPSLKFGAIPIDLRPWADQVANRFPAWAPAIARRIRASAPIGEVTIMLSEDDRFVAFASDHTIVVSVPYLRRVRDDVGVIGHELAHIFQNYPAGSESWLTEGIADYLRYYVLEPGSRRAGFDAGSSYRGGYQAAAWLLRHVEHRHGCAVIGELDAALRAGTYDPGFWPRRTGLDLDRLWVRATDALARSPGLLQRASRC